MQNNDILKFKDYPSEYGIVKRMREIRDELNAKLMNMTFEEEKAYYRESITQRYPNFYDEDMSNEHRLKIKE